MITVLVFKELRDNLQSFRFFISLLLCMILIPLSVYFNYRVYDEQRTAFRDAQTLYEQGLTGRQTFDKIEAKGFLEPSTLSVFSAGFSGRLPAEFSTDFNKGLIYTYTGYRDNVMTMLFGKVDFLFVVTAVMSLLAILFTFNAVSGEKEEGTLKLILSNTVPRRHILFAKFAGSFLTVSIPFVTGLLIALIVLTLNDASFLQQDNPGRLGLAILISFISMSVFLNLGLLVSSLSRKSTNASLMLLFLWVIGVLAFPKIGSMAAETLYPVESSQVVNLRENQVRKNILDEKKALLTEIWDDPDYTELREPVAAEFKTRELRELGAIETAHRNQKSEQQQLAKLISRLSPATCTVLSISELAGTGTLELANFIESSEQYYARIRDEVYSSGYADQSNKGFRWNFNWIELEDLPRFETIPVKTGRIASAILADVLLLILYNIILFAGAHLAFLRYDVR